MELQSLTKGQRVINSLETLPCELRARTELLGGHEVMGGNVRGRGPKDPNLSCFTRIELQPLFQHLQSSGYAFPSLLSYALPIHGPTKPQELLTLPVA